MNKRGQVTIFIILAIVVIAVVGFIFYTRGFFLNIGIGKETGQKFVDSQLESIKQYTEKCMRDSITNDLTLLKPNAGFFGPTIYYIDYEGVQVNYLISQIDGNGNKVNVMKLKDFIEGELSDHIKTKLNTECNLREYEEQFTIQKGVLRVDTLIADNRIVSVASYPVRISKEGFTGEIKEFRVDVISDFGRLYDVATDIVNEEMNTGDFDKLKYELENRDIIIGKDNIYMTDAVYTVTVDGDEVIIFAVRR